MQKYAFIFPGQGSQKVGMLQGYLSEETTEKLLSEASSALGFDLQELCQKGPAEKLMLTENAQPAILTVSYIAYQIFKERYPKVIPQYLAGHSLGEYTALLAGGAFSFSDAVKIVQLRGRYMQQSVPAGVGGMAALLGVSTEEALDLCRQAAEDQLLVPANYNCPGQIVVSGHKEALTRLTKIAKAVILPVSVPFHCSLIKDAELKMQEALDKCDIKDSSLPVVSNVDNRLLQKKEEIKKALVSQITAPVLWLSGIEKMLGFGVKHFIEFGHSKVLINMLKRIAPEAKGFTFSKAVAEHSSM